ncbi:MAG: hypothetical protein CMJ32_07435 [Phycisphaerae bacterium]|nr:hypothetical protein [Phycisphaerae bacterium]
MGLAATVGMVRPLVRTASVALVSTGDELVPPSRSTLEHGQIRNGNGVMLKQLMRGFGARVVHETTAPDDLDSTIEAIGAALEQADLVVTIGGISAGDRDHVAPAVQRLGGHWALRGASIQPGKPIAAVTIDSRIRVLCLPGNPVSVLATAHLFAWPVLLKASGTPSDLPWRTGRLADSIGPSRRERFRPAVLGTSGRIRVPAWAGSGDMAHAAMSNGLVQLPASTTLGQDASVRFLPYAGSTIDPESP